VVQLAICTLLPNQLTRFDGSIINLDHVKNVPTATQSNNGTKNQFKRRKVS